MANVYKKRFPQNPVHLTTGKAVRFEDFGIFGFYVTDDPVIIGEFAKCMAESRGGIQTATMEEYQEAVKKKLNSPISPSPSQIRELQTSGLVTLPPTPVVGAVAVPVVADVIKVPTAPPLEPKVGKRPTPK